MCSDRINPPVLSPDLVSIEDAAEFLGIHLATIYRWIEKRKITTIRVLGQTFFLIDQVKVIKEQRTGETR
jgi:excisionase family DNA binding protein